MDNNEYLDLIADEEHEVSKGFDRGLDFDDIKNKLTKHFQKLEEDYKILDPEEKYFNRRKKMKIQKLMYTCIALIQIRGGARISEAVEAFKLIINKKKWNIPVTVRIAKSGCNRFNRRLKKWKITKTRYRKIYFPNEWINIEYLNDEFINYSKNINNKIFKKRVLDYLLYNFNCNTHSLRYCYINYALYVKKVPLEIVSKIVGHNTQTQIMAYVQNKNCEDILANMFK
jgi:hypothetical protein